MNMIEFIGFIVSIVALIIIAVRRSMEERRRRRDPVAYEKEQERKRQALRQTLREMHIDIKEDDEEDVHYIDDEDDEDEDVVVPLPPRIKMPVITKTAPHRTVKDNYAPQPALAVYKTRSAVEERHMITEFEKEEKIAFRDVVSKDMQMDDAYEIRVVSDVSMGSKVLKALPSLKEMVILHEILDRPKALKYERPPR